MLLGYKRCIIASKEKCDKEEKKMPNEKYSYKNAFNVIVNLELIYKMYRSMGKQKAETLQNSDFYKEVLKISKPRLRRIRDGKQFILSKSERTYLSKLFNIEESYFCQNGKMIGVNSIQWIDWQVYFKCYYHWQFQLNMSINKQKERAEEIKTIITELGQEKKAESNYDDSHPLFRIYYYFKYNETYRHTTQLAKFTKELVNMKISDWDEIEEDLDQLSKYGAMLDKHNQYVQALLTYKKYRNQ